MITALSPGGALLEARLAALGDAVDERVRGDVTARAASLAAADARLLFLQASHMRTLLMRFEDNHPLARMAVALVGPPEVTDEINRLALRHLQRPATTPDDPRPTVLHMTSVAAAERVKVTFAPMKKQTKENLKRWGNTHWQCVLGAEMRAPLALSSQSQFRFLLPLKQDSV